MNKWNENNIEGVEFENCNKIYRVGELINEHTRQLYYKDGDKCSTWNKATIVSYLNENKSWKPLTEPINKEEELIFQLY